MPDIPSLSDMVVRFVSSGALGVGIAILLLAALAILLPPKDRAKVRLPGILIALHLLAVLLRLALPASSSLSRTLGTLALFLLLTALGRSLFLLVVDWMLGVRLSRPLPRIIREIVQGLVYAAVLLITLRASGVEPGSLLTTSALLTAVIGLSLQDTLGNLFAGLSIQAQRPFEVGDWIQIDPDPRLIGQVIEINWRATKVVTSEQVELTIPNGMLAKTPIKNFTKPTPQSRRTIEVLGPYDVSPRKVEEALLSAIHGIPGVLHEPPPFVLASRFADSGIAYHLCYFIDSFARRDRTDSAVRQRIWFSFQRVGIPMPFPTHVVHMEDMSVEQRAREDARKRARRAEALRGVSFLASLSEASLDQLAALSKTCFYALGETVIRQGDPGQELYILVAGEVAVIIGRDGGSTAEMTRLGPGSFFGEMSLMTGERRSATIQATADCEMVKVDKDAFHDILAATPGLAERITGILVERQLEIEENVSARSARAPAEADARSHALLDKIRKFFAL